MNWWSAVSLVDSCAKCGAHGEPTWDHCRSAEVGQDQTGQHLAIRRMPCTSKGQLDPQPRQGSCEYDGAIHGVTGSHEQSMVPALLKPIDSKKVRSGKHKLDVFRTRREHCHSGDWNLVHILTQVQIAHHPCCIISILPSSILHI